MTVLIAINTRDSIVLASDSQGTVTREFVPSSDLSEFFHPEEERELKTGDDGHPILDTWSRIASRTVSLPYKTYTDVEKIFSLAPLKMGVMASGIASLGDRTIKNLLSELRTTTAFQGLCEQQSGLSEVADVILDFFHARFREIYGENSKPEMEFMLCGYDCDRYTPGIVRLFINENRVAEPDYSFCIFFAGMTREIQRLVFGMDMSTRKILAERHYKSMKSYHDKIIRQCRERGIDFVPCLPEDFQEDYQLFSGIRLENLEMSCAMYTEQDAIECAEFMVNIMIKSQRFSNQVPTTGGKVQVAIIKKHTGFQMVTPRRSYADEFSIS